MIISTLVLPFAAPLGFRVSLISYGGPVG